MANELTKIAELMESMDLTQASKVLEILGEAQSGELQGLVEVLEDAREEVEEAKQKFFKAERRLACWVRVAKRFNCADCTI